MNMKKFFIAVALAALTLISCDEIDNSGSGTEYATVTIGGQTWNKAEIMTYSALVSDDEITFNLVLDADTKRTTTGHLTYYSDPKSITFEISGAYNSSMKEGTMSVKKVDDTHYSLNISGTDVKGNPVAIKGKATQKY